MRSNASFKTPSGVKNGAENTPVSWTVRFEMVIDPVFTSVLSLSVNLVPLIRVMSPLMTMVIVSGERRP